jgi:hypothetical protein
MQVLKTVFFKPIWHETQQITSQMGGTDRLTTTTTTTNNNNNNNNKVCDILSCINDMNK